MRTRLARLVTVALLTWFFLGGVFQFVPTIYGQAIVAVALGPSALFIVLFLSPFVYVFAGPADPSKLVFPMGVAVVALRIALGASSGADAILLVAGLTVATYLLYLPAQLLQGGGTTAGFDAIGFALGFALDATARALYGGSDPLTSSWGLPIVLLASGVAIASLVRDRRSHRFDGPHPPLRLGLRGAVRFGFIGLGIGAIVALQVTLFAYPSVLARFAAVPESEMTLAVFAGVGLGIGITARGFRPSRAMFLLGNGVLFAAVLDLSLIGSPILPLLVAIAEIAVVTDLALFLRYLHQGSPTLAHMGFAFGIAGIVFIAHLFAFALTLAYAFVPARSLWEGRLPLFLGFLAFVAVSAALLVAWRTRVHETRIDAAPGRMPVLLRTAGVILLAAATVGSVLPAGPSASGSSTIVVMTYNIHQGFGADGVLGIQRIAEVIRQADADIVALQESDTARVSSGNQDAIRFLARHLGYYEAYGPPTRDQIFGVSILSRFPILRWTTIFLPSLEAQRVLVEADVQVGPRVLRVYSVHFGLEDPERSIQADFVRSTTAAAPAPKILLGDFNSIANEYCPGDQCSQNVYGKLTLDWDDSWTAAGHPLMANSGRTWPASSPIVRVDYVFVDPGIAVVSAEVPRTAFTGIASDHLPVVVKIVLP